MVNLKPLELQGLEDITNAGVIEFDGIFVSLNCSRGKLTDYLKWRMDQIVNLMKLQKINENKNYNFIFKVFHNTDYSLVANSIALSPVISINNKLYPLKLNFLEDYGEIFSFTLSVRELDEFFKRYYFYEKGNNLIHSYYNDENGNLFKVITNYTLKTISITNVEHLFVDNKEEPYFTAKAYCNPEDEFNSSNIGLLVAHDKWKKKWQQWATKFLTTDHTCSCSKTQKEEYEELIEQANKLNEQIKKLAEEVNINSENDNDTKTTETIKFNNIDKKAKDETDMIVKLKPANTAILKPTKSSSIYTSENMNNDYTTDTSTYNGIVALNRLNSVIKNSWRGMILGDFVITDTFADVNKHRIIKLTCPECKETIYTTKNKLKQNKTDLHCKCKKENVLYCVPTSSDVPSDNSSSNTTNGYDLSDSTIETDYVTLKEIHGNLFDAPAWCYIAHCIPGDLSFGGSVARKINRLWNLKAKLTRRNAKTFNPGVVLCVDNVFNLIASPKAFTKTNLSIMEECIEELALYCYDAEVNLLCMPKIGCGANGLNWKDVKKMIIEIFERIYVENNTDLFIENEDNGITEYVGNKIEINVYTIDY